MRQGRTVVWTCITLLALELVARVVSSDRALLRLRVASLESSFARRRLIARTLSGVDVVVTGDSTAERGIDGCALGRALGVRGANLAVPSGALEHANVLVRALPGASAGRRVVFATRVLQTEAVSPALPVTFGTRAATDNLPSAVLGEVSALYGQRGVLLAALTSWRHPRAFNQEVLGATECGLALTAPPEGIPADPAAQLTHYDLNWHFANVRGMTAAERESLVGALHTLAAGARDATVVLMPMRADARARLELRAPGARRALTGDWGEIARRSGARLLDCVAGAADEGFYDPIHLNAAGAQAFTACLAASLEGAPGCCVAGQPPPGAPPS